MTAYEMRISDWSSDVCSSDLLVDLRSEKSAPFGIDLPRLARMAAQFAIFDQIGGGILAQPVAHAIGQRHAMRDRIDDRRRSDDIADAQRRKQKLRQRTHKAALPRTIPGERQNRQRLEKK